MQAAKPLISLVVPVYNEEDTLPLFYPAVRAVIDPLIRPVLLRVRLYG